MFTNPFKRKNKEPATIGDLISNQMDEALKPLTPSEVQEITDMWEGDDEVKPVLIPHSLIWQDNGEDQNITIILDHLVNHVLCTMSPIKCRLSIPGMEEPIDADVDIYSVAMWVNNTCDDDNLCPGFPSDSGTIQFLLPEKQTYRGEVDGISYTLQKIEEQEPTEEKEDSVDEAVTTTPTLEVRFE